MIRLNVIKHDKNPERKHDHCNLYFRQILIKSIFLLKHHICHVFLKIVGNFFFCNGFLLNKRSSYTSIFVQMKQHFFNVKHFVNVSGFQV